MTCRLRWYGQNRNQMADVWANSMACHHTASCHIAWCCHRRIQRHVIPEPRITLQGAATCRIHCYNSRATCTLQGAVTWRNQCHDRATLQGVKLFHPPYWKSFFAIFYFIFGFLMEFRLWRAAAFVSFPIHLLLLWISLFTSEQRSKQWKNNK